MANSTDDDIQRTLRETGLCALPEMHYNEVRGMVRTFLDGDGNGFGCCAYPCGGQLDLVEMNEMVLRERGIYEAALVTAYTGCKQNNLGWPVLGIEVLFREADRDRLIAAGEPFPGDGPFVIYRGVCGKGHERRVRGLSWTDSIDVACWFALRYSPLSAALNDPAVYHARVQEEEVFCYRADRDEGEFIVRPRRPVRLPLTLAEIEVRSKAHSERTRQCALGVDTCEEW